MKKRRVRKFNDWTGTTVNCCTGCSNNCRYCYAKGMAVRFKRVAAEQWGIERIRQKDVDKKYKKFNEMVMFPSSHDITPVNYDACATVLKKLTDAGNEVLVVSKPRFECIARLCDSFQAHRDQILFRFTIGAMDDDILSFWEPGAPPFGERIRSLCYAYYSGYQTSVSIEPMLQSERIVELVDVLEPIVTESIWIGKMNHIKKNIVIDTARTAQALQRIEQGQRDEAIGEIYETLKDRPIIRWKGSIRNIVDPEDNE